MTTQIIPTGPPKMDQPLQHLYYTAYEFSNWWIRMRVGFTLAMAVLARLMITVWEVYSQHAYDNYGYDLIPSSISLF